MNRLVLPRLYGGSEPALRALGIVMTALGFGVLMLAARSMTLPVEPIDLRARVICGTIAFVGGSIIGSLLAAALWELRTCSFAWNTPRLAGRAARELRIGCAVVFGIAAGLGTTLHAAMGTPTWLPAIAACLGYAVGMLNMDPAWLRSWGLGSLLAAGLPIYLMPELTAASAYAGWIGAALSAALAFGIIEFNGAGRARRDRTKLDPGGSGYAAGVSPGSWDKISAATPEAPRDGAAPFAGVRRSDGDWVRALLHEVYGRASGGLPILALRVGAALLIFATLMQTYLGIAAVYREQGATVVPGATSALGRITSALSGFSVERFAGAHDNGGIAPTAFCVAIVMSILITGTPTLPLLGVVRPLSRQRLARLLWQRTQIEEAVVMIAALSVLLIATALLDALVASDPWPNFRHWALALAAVFVLQPLARWIRLVMLDAKNRRPTSVGFDLPSTIAHCCIMAVLIAGSIPLIHIWLNAAGAPGPLRVVVVLGSVAGALGLRWMWYGTLARFCTQRDLPGS